MTEGAERLAGMEHALYDTIEVGARPIKVAMLIVRAFGTSIPSEDLDLMDEALARLARRPDIEVYGIISNWRGSEVRRLAVPG